MGARGIRLLGAAIAVALAAAALPAACEAYQTITVEPNGLSPGEVLVIRGDQVKDSDEITVTYDKESGEFVITHDILEPLPPECHSVGAGPPFKEVRCAGSAIVGVYIYAGGGKDKVITHLERPQSPLQFVVTYLAGGGDLYIGGEENDEVFDEEDGGSDSVDLGGGDNVAFLANGNNVLTAGDGNNQVSATDGNQKITLGNGHNEVKIGDGNSRITGGDGGSWISVGAGKSTVKLSGGANWVRFAGGPDVFYGGSGPDRVSLGPGADVAFGGPGPDKLYGGPGGDRLYGGSGFDLLNAGPGADMCFGGPGGARPVRCEIGVHYAPPPPPP